MSKHFFYLILLTLILLIQKIIMPYKTELPVLKHDSNLKFKVDNIPRKIQTKLSRNGINSHKKYIFEIKQDNFIEIIPISSGGRRNISISNILSLLKVDNLSQIDKNKLILEAKNEDENRFYACLENDMEFNDGKLTRGNKKISSNIELMTSIYKLKPTSISSCLFITTNNLRNFNKINDLKKLFAY